MENGEQCVMICGEQLMPEWCVDNWDLAELVMYLHT